MPNKILHGGDLFATIESQSFAAIAAYLNSKLQWPSDPEEIIAKIASTENAVTEVELATAQAALVELTIDRTGEPGYEQVVSVAASRLQTIKKQLAKIRENQPVANQKPNASEAHSEN